MAPVPGLLRSLSDRLLKARPHDPVRMPLTLTPELGVLHHVADIGKGSVHQLQRPGVVSRWVESGHIEESVLRERLDGRVAGHDIPGWADGSGGAPLLGMNLCRVYDAVYAPEFGAVITADGNVLHSSIGEALYLTPTLSALPGVVLEEGGPTLYAPADTPELASASVFMAWGGRFNYGHFLLDCLSSLQALIEADLIDRYPAIAPPLTSWHRQALRLMLGAKAEDIREIPAPLLFVDDLVFATGMDHFLHGPNTPLDSVRERMLAAAAPGSGVSKRVYLSRQGLEKRRMVNEADLEAALAERGFDIIAPETMSVAAQIALFRDAHTIVGPTGAAFANCLFCSPGAKVFEIQPSNFTGIWSRGLCHFVEAHWHGYFAKSPLQETEVYIEGALRPGAQFDWSLPLPEFLAFLDARL